MLAIFGIEPAIGSIHRFGSDSCVELRLTRAEESIAYGSLAPAKSWGASGHPQLKTLSITL